MVTFEQTLDPVNWTEVLQGGSFVAFDIVAAQTVEVYFSESGTPPATSVKGNEVHSYPSSYDFEMTGADRDTQRVWD